MRRKDQRVTCSSKSAVADHLARLWIEKLDHFVEQHGYVPIFVCQSPTLLVEHQRIQVLLEGSLSGLPAVRVPDFEVIDVAHDGDFAL